MTHGSIAMSGGALQAFERRVSAYTHAQPVVIRPAPLKVLRAGPSIRQVGASQSVRASGTLGPGVTGGVRRRPASPIPRIKKISPHTGPAGTGTKVTITGSGFGAKRISGAYVRFAGTTKNAVIHSWSNTRVV